MEIERHRKGATTFLLHKGTDFSIQSEQSSGDYCACLQLVRSCTGLLSSLPNTSIQYDLQSCCKIYLRDVYLPP